MRWLKLRAWFPEKQEMKLVAMHNVYEGNTTYLYLSPMPMSDYETIELMQYTGLKDKNGREVYDGDIVNAWSQVYKGRFEVKWRQEGSSCWILYPAWKNNEFWKIHGTLHEDGQFYDKGLEVIGNIYENPELLGG